MKILRDLKQISIRNGREGFLLLTILYFERICRIKWPFKILKLLCQGHFLCDISPYSFISPQAICTCRMPHPYLIIINSDAQIGENVTIYHNVTLGNRERLGVGGIDIDKMVIKDGVYIGCGATIIGSVTIGENVRIAAHAIVLSDVHDNKTVAGIVK